MYQLQICTFQAILTQEDLTDDFWLLVTLHRYPLAARNRCVAHLHPRMVRAPRWAEELGITRNFLRQNALLAQTN